MQMVSNISFFAMFVMYFLTAIFGYLTFYEKVQSDLLHKYQSKGDILILTVRLAVIVAVILTVPVLFFTVSEGPSGSRENSGLWEFSLTSGSCSEKACHG